MERLAAHKKKWLHNREFLSTISDRYSDWMVIAAFYAALHSVETLFAHDGTDSQPSHQDRNNILKRTTRYQHIWKYYGPLYSASQTVRYAKGGWIPPDKVKSKIIGHYLHQIEKSVMKLLDEDAPGELPKVRFASELATTDAA